MLGMATHRKKIPGIMRAVLAANIAALMEHKFQGADNKPMKLAKSAGCSLSTVQRAISMEAGASIDTIEQLALALDVSPYQLIIPSLDIQNPQIVTGASSAEKRMYANMVRRSIPKKPPAERVPASTLPRQAKN